MDAKDIYFASPVPSAKLDTAQHWPSIDKSVAEEWLPILRCCWNDNSGMHLVANAGPNSGRQHLFSAQQRANPVPTSGFLTSRIRENWLSMVPILGQVSAEGREISTVDEGRHRRPTT